VGVRECSVGVLSLSATLLGQQGDQNERVLVPYSSLTSIIVSRLRKMDLASVIHHLKDERTLSAQNQQSPVLFQP